MSNRFSTISFTLLFSLALSQVIYAQSAEEIAKQYQKLLDTMSPERRAQIFKIAQRWAPDIFAASSVSKLGDKQQMKAYDIPVSPFFDGDKDLTNNKSNLLAMENAGFEEPQMKQRAEIPFFFKETPTHYFISYLKYNVYEAAMIGAHEHDAETVFTVIRKDGSETGTLEFVATNAHGIPSFYAPDPELEKYLRETFEKYKAEGKTRKKMIDNFAGLDPTAKAYENGGLGNWSKNGARFPVYSAPGKHALSLCDRNQWKTNGLLSGVQLTCSTNNVADPIDPLNIVGTPYRYSLLSMDELNRDFYFDVTPEKIAQRSLIFDESRLSSNNGMRQGLPQVFVKGLREKSAEANFDWDLRLNTGGNNFSQPHRAVQMMYQELPPTLKEKYGIVSGDYLFNPTIDVQAMNPPANLEGLKNCLTNSWEQELLHVINKP